MVNKSIDMRVYNESKQQSKNLLAHYPKTTMAFNLCFDLDWMNELEWTRINWKWLNMKSFTRKHVPNNHTEKSVKLATSVKGELHTNKSEVVDE